jgi:hypothetical protein
MWVYKSFERELDRGLMIDWLDRSTNTEKQCRLERVQDWHTNTIMFTSFK